MRTGTARARGQMQEVAGRRNVNTQAKDRNGPYHESSTDEEILHRVFEPGQEPAFVRIGAGLTINLQNYESLRIDASVTLPCLPNEIEQAQQIASQYVADAIAAEETNWLGQSKKRG